MSLPLSRPVLLLVLLAGCLTPEPPPDEDGGVSSDGGATMPDAGVPAQGDAGEDAGAAQSDAGVGADAGMSTRDAGVLPDAGASGGGYVLEAAEDTYVRSDLPSINYGTTPFLVADTDVTPPLTKRFFLRFQVGGGQISRAVLRLFASNGSAAGVKIYKASDTAWTELGTNDTNKPALGTTLLATVPTVAADAGVSVDLTSVVTANRPLSLSVVGVSDDGVIFNAREAAANPPQLEITTTNAAPYACPACAAGRTCDGATGLCVCAAGSCSTPFKVLQFNIFEGAVGNLPNGTPKIDAIAAIIQAVAPDLVSVNEANSQPNFAALATKTGMFQKLCTATNGYHVGVLSKRPFASTQCYATSPITKTVNIVSVSVGAKTVWVYATHTTATGTEADREEEMSAVVALAAQHPNDPRIIVGDFNSVAHSDGPTTGLVSPVLTTARYVDAYREVHPDAAAFPGSSFVGSAVRLDYLFHDDRRIRATGAQVVTRPDPWPSDHYAVWAQFDLLD